MIYLLNDGEDNRYRIFDVRTDTLCYIEIDTLKKLLEIDGNYLINGKIDGVNGIRNKFIRDEELHTSLKYAILIGRVGDGQYAFREVYKYDTGNEFFGDNINVLDVDYIKEYIRDGYFINCSYENDVYKTEYLIDTDDSYIKQVDKEYAKHERKLDILGYGDAYDLRYIVIGRDVLLSYLDCKCTKIVIPNYITAITRGSIVMDNKNIHLGKNIKALGAIAISHDYGVDEIKGDVYINNNLEYTYKDSICGYNVIGEYNKDSIII